MYIIWIFLFFSQNFSSEGQLNKLSENPFINFFDEDEFEIQNRENNSISQLNQRNEIILTIKKWLDKNQKILQKLDFPMLNKIRSTEVDSIDIVLLKKAIQEIQEIKKPWLKEKIKKENISNSCKRDMKHG